MQFDWLRKLLILGIFACLPLVVFAQQNQIGKIAHVSVSGNVITDSSIVKLSSGLLEDEDISWEDVQDAMKQLWELGIYADVKILMNKKTSEGLFLTIQVKEYPRLSEVVIEGNKKLKTNDLEKEIGFFRGQIVSPHQLLKAQNKLKAKYAEKGYILAEIKTDTLPGPRKGRVIAKFDIDEGKKVQIKRIRFFGNTEFEDSKLRKQMKKIKEDRWWRSADFDKEEFDEDKKKVVEFYNNEGFRDAEVIKDSIYYDDVKQDMFIDLWVREGHCYYIGDISWEGNFLFTEEGLETKLEFSKGDAFSQEDFDKTIYENLQGLYYDLGYIYAQITPRETLRGKDTLDIHFIVTEGNPVRVRKILISGNTRTKDRVLRRELRLRPGDVFSKELLMRSHRDLMMLNYFATVEPNVLPANEEELDLTFKVEEKSTDTANMSAGWSELDRLIGSIGLGMNNLFGNGQQLSLDWNFGRYYRSFNVGFTEPWFMNTPTLIGVNFFDTKREAYYIGYSQRMKGLSLRFGRRFRWPDNFFRGDWIYRLEEQEYSDFSAYILEWNPNNITGIDWPLTSSSITQILSRNSLNNPEFPTRGSSVSLSTSLSGGLLGGVVNYHKHIFSSEFFIPVISDKLILMARGKMGYMEKIGSKENIFPWDYFHIGGGGLSRSEPLRGYEDPLVGGSISSEGGKTMLKTTFELRFPIVSNPTMFGLLFTEAGETWQDLKHTDPFNLKRSVGIGARLFMPMVGIIGFDYGYGFDRVDSDGNRKGAWKTHFVFGRSF